MATVWYKQVNPPQRKALFFLHGLDMYLMALIL